MKHHGPMPTVMKIDGFRFFFYSNEGPEPPHIHVESGDAAAKVWLEPIALQSSHQYSSKEQGRILKLVGEHQVDFLEAWHDHFRRS